MGSDVVVFQIFDNDLLTCGDFRSNFLEAPFVMEKQDFIEVFGNLVCLESLDV